MFGGLFPSNRTTPDTPISRSLVRVLEYLQTVNCRLVYDAVFRRICEGFVAVGYIGVRFKSITLDDEHESYLGVASIATVSYINFALEK